MSTDETLQDAVKPDVEEPQQPPTEPAAMATAGKKRPRLDLDALNGGARERKRGKSMFGLLLGTLNKAKIEDKERSASEAAKKRQLIEQRLQHKLRKETDSVRRAEEAKKDKMSANRKEEELQLKDSIYKYRRTRLPLLANFLLTSDVIHSDDSTPPPPSSNPLAGPRRSHPPPLYYLPAILTPAQEAFINRRKAEVVEAAEKEWVLFREERATGIVEINQLRQRVADEEARRKTEKAQETEEMETDGAPPPSATEEVPAGEATATAAETAVTAAEPAASMDVDKTAGGEEEKEPALLTNTCYD
ncbi:putative pinin/SDK/memA/ protein conserved region [Lyophyllum shimeji]|uniref:Pinin/SDK/memA/ protein conserved region n=1 Tax=Lyophyllum shimeji TaxID=47721 RepID=A0A9P3PKP2_LYOSH|nr:putative pinin/SDK/memA/ protein conserved region [Lyophyllum shimeji]